MIQEQKNFELILDYLAKDPGTWGWAKYNRIRQAVIDMLPKDVETVRCVNGLLSITTDKGKQDARDYLINKYKEVNMAKIKALSREERLAIATRNTSDRMVDIYLESERPFHREMALDIAGDYWAQARKLNRNDRKINMLGALLERAKNMDDCERKDQLLGIIIKNLGYDRTDNPMESFKTRALKTVMHGKDDKVKEQCVKHLLTAFKGR